MIAIAVWCCVFVMFEMPALMTLVLTFMTRSLDSAPQPTPTGKKYSLRPARVNIDVCSPAVTSATTSPPVLDAGLEECVSTAARMIL